MAIPIKRKQRKSKKYPKIPFSDAEKEHNNKMIRQRGYVENATGGMKRYRSLTHRLRCRDADYYSMTAGGADGLWTFSLEAE